MRANSHLFGRKVNIHMNQQKPATESVAAPSNKVPFEDWHIFLVLAAREKLYLTIADGKFSFQPYSLERLYQAEQLALECLGEERVKFRYEELPFAGHALHLELELADD
jgi:hypothetical protein